MLHEIADLTEVFLGFGEPYPKADIVNFIAGTTGLGKEYWNNKSDSIYYSYHKAVKERGYKAWNVIDPAASEKISKFVSDDTGIDYNTVYQYLLTLYTMQKMGKIPTTVWNPATGTIEYGTQQAAKAIQTFLQPVTQTAGAPTKQLLTALLIAAGLTAIGIFSAKEFIKKKA